MSKEEEEEGYILIIVNYLSICLFNLKGLNSDQRKTKLIIIQAQKLENLIKDFWYSGTDLELRNELWRCYLIEVVYGKIIF